MKFAYDTNYFPPAPSAAQRAAPGCRRIGVAVSEIFEAMGARIREIPFTLERV